MDVLDKGLILQQNNNNPFWFLVTITSDKRVDNDTKCDRIEYRKKVRGKREGYDADSKVVEERKGDHVRFVGGRSAFVQRGNRGAFAQQDMAGQFYPYVSE